MATTIRNPVEWTAAQLAAASSYLASVGDRVGADAASGPAALPEPRTLTRADLAEALRRGYDDFLASRMDVAFLCVVYPLAGGCLAWIAFDHRFLGLIFPVLAGFAIVGPVAAVGLYEMSRRRERGEHPSWTAAFGVLASPSFGAIVLLGLILFAVFVVWILVAQAIYVSAFGPEPPASLGALAGAVLTTREGATMAVLGIAVGAAFAAAALALSVVSFPLLLDRRIGLFGAIVTSLRVCARNPGPVATWGAIVAGGLVLGSLPALLGLIVVLPVLGHATWHLYRRAVEPGPDRRDVGSAG